MTVSSRSPVPAVLNQHLDDAIALRQTRAVLVRAPHVKLRFLARLDERLAAALDGLAVAGNAAGPLHLSALERPTRGAVFAAAIHAIESADAPSLQRLLAVAQALEDGHPALASALGWVSPASLRGLAKTLLSSPEAAHRRLGLAACVMHQVDPGALLGELMAQGECPADLLASAHDAAGRLGRVDLLPACLGALAHADPLVQLAGARAALRLGDRQQAVEKLMALTQAAGPHRLEALVTVLKVLPADRANALLKPWAQEPKLVRGLIRGVGMAGDPHYVPWLIKQMADPKLTRLAGEAFSTITGLDLALLDLEVKPPEDAVFGPNDDPADADVALDEDDSLPWPDADKIAAWWQANGARFQPGTRYFVGEPPSVAHCVSVLKNGFQRQRMAAADYLCLLTPGTALFNVAAPAWRQQRQLAQMQA